jgi:hypothetical protein
MGSATRQISEKKPGALTMKFLHQGPQTVILLLEDMHAGCHAGHARVHLSRSKKAYARTLSREIPPPENRISADAIANVPVTAQGADLYRRSG